MKPIEFKQMNTTLQIPHGFTDERKETWIVIGTLKLTHELYMEMDDDDRDYIISIYRNNKYQYAHIIFGFTHPRIPCALAVGVSKNDKNNKEVIK